MFLRALGLTALLALTACGSTAEMQLYPTAGPFAAETPPPVIHAKAETTEETSGALTFKLPDPPKCKGAWSALAPQVVSVGVSRVTSAPVSGSVRVTKFSWRSKCLGMGMALAGVPTKAP